MPRVSSETLYVYFDDERSRRALVTGQILDAGGFDCRNVLLTPDEQQGYVQLATLVDDGEAQALAVAATRRAIFLSDDGLGLRLAIERDIETATTLDLAQAWSRGRSAHDVHEACCRLKNRARYGVPSRHHLAAWYSQYLL